MSDPLFRKGWLGEFTMLTLSNDKLRVDILPDLGARIWNLFDVANDVQWIWHHPTVGVSRFPIGSRYDDHWAGGWEQLFPNDAEGEFGGRFLPDHGEWWTLPWEWEVAEQDDLLEIHLYTRGVVTDTTLEKWVAIGNATASVSVRYRIVSRELLPIKFLFKEHLPINASSLHKLELPGGSVTPVDLSFSTRIGSNGPFAWPAASGRHNEKVDLASFPRSEEKQREFVYVSQVPEGWCGVVDSASGRRIRMRYPQEVFPYVWLFMTFGGWRDLYTVVLEPCTNMPKDLQTAASLGQCATLTPCEAFEFGLSVELS
jgi:hypothetical protein